MFNCIANAKHEPTTHSDYNLFKQLKVAMIHTSQKQITQSFYQWHGLSLGSFSAILPHLMTTLFEDRTVSALVKLNELLSYILLATFQFAKNFGQHELVAFMNIRNAWLSLLSSSWIYLINLSTISRVQSQFSVHDNQFLYLLAVCVVMVFAAFIASVFNSDINYNISRT